MTTMIAPTKPELAVYNALTKLGIEFEWQSPMLGLYREKGSTIADFYIPLHSLVISVIGEYWHSFPETRARDQLQRIALESQGIRVIGIDESDANRNARFYCEEALRGISHSKMI